MECKICNSKCIIPTSSYATSSQNILIEEKDGSIICSACSDVKDFANSIIEKPNNKRELNSKQIESKPPRELRENKVFYNCLKCKSTFTGRVCTCGFINPLYKRK